MSLTVAVEGKVARARPPAPMTTAWRRSSSGALAAAALRPPDPDFAGFAPPAPVPPSTIGTTGPPAPRPTSGRPWSRPSSRRARVWSPPGYCATYAHPRAGGDDRAAGGRAQVTTPSSTASTGRSDGGQGRHRRRLCPGHVGPLRGSRWRGLRRPGRRQGRVGPDPMELPPGNYEVVLEPSAMASALVFPLYGFNGKAHADGTSFVHLGEQQWDAAVDIWDDTTDPRALGVGFDAEGTPEAAAGPGAGWGLVRPDARPPLRRASPASSRRAIRSAPRRSAAMPPACSSGEAAAAPDQD